MDSSIHPHASPPPKGTSHSVPPPPSNPQSQPRQSQPPPPPPTNPRKRPRESNTRFPPLNKLPTALLCTCTTEHEPGPAKATYFIPTAPASRIAASRAPTELPPADPQSMQSAINALPIEHCRDVLLGLPEKQLRLLALNAASLDEGIAARMLERHMTLFSPPVTGPVLFENVVEHNKAMIGSLLVLYRNNPASVGDSMKQSLWKMVFLNVSTIHSHALAGVSWRTRANALAALLEFASWLVAQLKDTPMLYMGLVTKSPIGPAFLDICSSMTWEERLYMMATIFNDRLFSVMIEEFSQHLQQQQQHQQQTEVFPEIAEAIVLLRQSKQPVGGASLGEARSPPNMVTTATTAGTNTTTITPISPSTPLAAATVMAKKGRPVASSSKPSSILTFDKELERFEVSYYERHNNKGYPEQVTAGTQIARQIMGAARRAALRATPDTAWQTRANVLAFMCGIMNVVANGNGMPLGSSVRQEFFTMSQEFVRLFRDIIGNMTDTEKQTLRAWRPPKRRQRKKTSDGAAAQTHQHSGSEQSFEDTLEGLAVLVEEVQLFYDLDKCLELLRGGHPLFLRCEESWCVSNLFKKIKVG